jgi:hypothetical protein
MKHLARILSLLLLVSSVLFSTSCSKDDDGEPETDTQINLLNGTWTATSVTYEGVEDGDYDNFSITVNGTKGNEFVSYTTAGRPSKLGPWTSSGTLEFGEPAKTVLVRDDDTSITYAVTETTLHMEFDYTGDGYFGGRTESIGGHWVFEFTKQ